MKTVRVWFSKDDTARYISHLDLNRVILRAINMAKLPIQYTQGFHPHPSIIFDLPLSVGMRCSNDSVDIKLANDIDYKSTVDKLNNCLPCGIKIKGITDPRMKQKDIRWAEFEMVLYSKNNKSNDLNSIINKLLNGKNIFIDKKTKSGVKKIDIKPHIKSCKAKVKDEKNLSVNILLPAGSQVNINPILFIRAVSIYGDLHIFYDITRLKLYNNEMKEFC